MTVYRRVDDLTVTCRLTACTPGSAPGPTLGIEYGKPLPFFTMRVKVRITDTHNRARWGCSCPRKGHNSSPFSAHVYCGQTVAHLSYCWALVKLSREDGEWWSNRLNVMFDLQPQYKAWNMTYKFIFYLIFLYAGAPISSPLIRCSTA